MTALPSEETLFPSLLLELLEKKTLSEVNPILRKMHQSIEGANDLSTIKLELLKFEESLLSSLQKGFTLRPVQLCLPAIFARCNLKTRHSAHWIAIAQRLHDQSLQAKGTAKLEILAAVAAHQALGQEPNQALIFLIILIISSNLKEVSVNNITELALRLISIDWFHTNDLEFRTSLIKILHHHGPHKGQRELWIAAAILLGMNANFSRYGEVATPELIGFIFHNIMIPLLESLSENNQHDHLLIVEQQIYDSYLRIKDTAEHYFHVKYQITPRLLNHSRKIRKELPQIHALPPKNSRQKVVFFIVNTTNLAHSRVLLNYLRGQISLAESNIEPIVAFYNLIESDFLAELKSLGITLFFPKVNGFAGILETRRWCIEQEISAFIYVSTSAMMPIYFGIGMAPTQIYWSLKYHCEIFDEIHGYMASGAFQRYRRIGGRDWRAGHCAILGLFDPNQTAPAQATRATLSAQGQHLLLGSFGREVKYNNDEFVAALAQILEQVPEALYLWTGRIEAPEILARFQKFGIADRCRFIGWVNTAHYAQVIDLYVDTFPFASGHTAMEAMAAACPVVLLATQEALDSSIATHVLPAYRGQVGTQDQQQQIRAIFTDSDGSSLLPMVDSVSEFIAWSVKLARDPALRARTGAAAQRFVQESLGDVQQMARDYNEHILEIIDEQRQRQHSHPA